MGLRLSKIDGNEFDIGQKQPDGRFGLHQIKMASFQVQAGVSIKSIK